MGFDHSGVEVFVVSEELQVSGVVLEISLGDSSDNWSKKKIPFPGRSQQASSLHLL